MLDDPVKMPIAKGGQIPIDHVLAIRHIHHGMLFLSLERIAARKPNIDLAFPLIEGDFEARFVKIAIAHGGWLSSVTPEGADGIGGEWFAHRQYCEADWAFWEGRSFRFKSIENGLI